MELSKDHWQKVDAVLDELLDLSEEQRLPRLNQLHDPESTLHKDIHKLLKSCTAEDSPLDQKAFELLPTFFEQYVPNLQSNEINALVGVKIGPYTLDAEIGRGGMGVVYRARRTQGDFEQTVAVKLLLNVTVAVAERFRREQQALASLKHPNITHLYDGGLSESGHPFLVMEYIDGTSITDYCREHKLNLAARLVLLDQVLEAITFSHKNLVVHRDIKASNIMVTRSGQVKLLDFSIAKLMDTSLNLDQTETQLGLFTPSSSAPEQVLNQTITVATDIYQLGLLYFRVLTGHDPLPASVNSLHELVQVVCQQEVAKPSQVLLDAGEPVEVIAQPKELSRQLSGDLDAILAKMLRKKPAERYTSIEALKADLSAYRQHLPVAARKAVAGYQARKYLVRNWRTITLVAAGAIVLSAYSFSMKVQNDRVSEALTVAEQEREKAQLEQQKAEQVASFLSQTFEAADPNQGGLEETTAEDLLENARTKINEELKDTPEIQAALLNIFSKIYYRQRDFEKANELLTNLLEENGNVEGIDGSLFAEIQLRLAQQRIGLAEFESAEELLKESLRRQEQQGDSKKAIYGETMAFLGLTLFRQQKREQAHEVINRSIEQLLSLGEEGDRMRSFALNILANDQFLYGKLDSAIQNMREALEIKISVLGEEHSATTNTELGLSQMLVVQEAFPEAEKITGVAYEKIKMSLPEDHPHRLRALYLLAFIAYRQHRYEEADLIVDNLLSTKIGTGAVNAIKTHAKLLKIENLLYQSRLDDAQELILGIDSIPEGKRDMLTFAQVSMHKGRMDLIKGNVQSATKNFKEGLEAIDPTHSGVQPLKRDLAAALLANGNAREAKKTLEEVILVLTRRYSPDHSQIKIACSMLYYAKLELDSKTNVRAPSCSNVVGPSGVFFPIHLRPFMAGIN